MSVKILYPDKDTKRYVRDKLQAPEKPFKRDVIMALHKKKQQLIQELNALEINIGEHCFHPVAELKFKETYYSGGYDYHGNTERTATCGICNKTVMYYSESDNMFG